jgi:hypothetical protein
VSDLLTRAELAKVARVLGADLDAVEFLSPLNHLELRELGRRLSASLFDEHRAAFQRLADASRLLPASLVARMSELVFGPMLSARIAGLMPPERAVEVSQKLKPKFLAEVTMELDPRSASELLAIMPTRTVIEVARLLLQRREYLTMGRFVDDLTNEAIRAVMEELRDDEALVRVGFFVERPERLAELAELLAPERVRGLIAAVVRNRELQPAGLALMSQLTARQKGRFGEAAIAMGPETLNALIAAARLEGAPEVVGQVMQGVSPAGREAFARMLSDMDAGALAAWARASGEAGLWPAALRILAGSPRTVQDHAAAALARLDGDTRASIGAVARREGLLGQLGALARLLGQ